MCHVPPGNPGNAHTICINASAVPAHLANGSVLGACGELQAACGGAAMRMASNQTEATEAQAIDMNAIPNPFSDNLTISVTIPTEGDYTIVLLDIHGKVVKNVYAGSFDEMETRILDIETNKLAQGMYVLKVSDKYGFVGQTKMIIKR